MTDTKVRERFFASHAIPIARFDGRAILPFRAEIDTLGDCLDHGLALHVQCGCSPRIVEVWPSKLLTLPHPPAEAARLSQLRPWLRCEKCGSRDRITVRPTDEWRGGLIPRKRQAVKKLHRSDFVPTGGLTFEHEPVIDPHPRCGGRNKRKSKA